MSDKTPTMSYIVISGNPKRLWKDRNGVLWFTTIGNPAWVEYDKVRDGTPLTLEELGEKYPELLI